MAQPDGYDTAVGGNGVTLAAGKRQRLLIARALVLLLDEGRAGVAVEHLDDAWRCHLHDVRPLCLRSEMLR